MSPSSEFTSFLLNILLALVPILGWIYFFQKKQTEKRINVIFAFLGGMISVFPIKLYEKYWDISVYHLSNINIFKQLSLLVNEPSLPNFLSYTIVSVIAALGLYLFVAVIMFIFEVLSGNNSTKVYANKTLKILESPGIFVSVGLIIGLIAYFSSFSLHQKIWFFVMVGMLEEFVKHLFLRFSDDENITSIDDALEYAILVALGFAFVENIFYFQDMIGTKSVNAQEFGIFILLRSGISVAAHVIFSAIFGYYYGLARFSNLIYTEEQKSHQHPIINMFHLVLHLKGSTLYHEEKMMMGLIISVVLHAIFNTLLEFGQIHLIIPFILILFFVILHLFHRWEFKVVNFHVVKPMKKVFRTDMGI